MRYDRLSLRQRSLTTLDSLIAARKAERDRGSAAAAAIASLASFVAQGWHALDPVTPLVWNWHIDAICIHLEAAARGEITRLLINIPPGHMKSLLVCVFFPAWMWLHNPSWKSVFGSYAWDLSKRDSGRCRDLIASDWYQETFQPTWRLKPDDNRKDHFSNTAFGYRTSVAVGTKGTGLRGDAIIFDDPLNVEEFPSDEKLEKARSWWDYRMSSRLNNLETGLRIGVMQRIHENDPSGHILRRGRYVHLCLPTEFDPSKRCSTRYFTDPRTEPGELLFERLVSREAVAEARNEDLGEDGFEAQHNQNPAPPGGKIWKKHWFRFWYPRDADRPRKVMTAMPDGTVHLHQQRPLPKKLDEVWQSWDMAFKVSTSTSRVAGQVWATKGANRFLLAQICRRMSFTDTIDAVRTLTAEFPGCNGKLVEDKANGPAVMDSLRDEVGGFIPFEPQGSKEARAHAAAPIVQSGNVYLPHPEIYPWVSEYIHVVTFFPAAKTDDEMDASTQMLNWLRNRGFNLLEALTK